MSDEREYVARVELRKDADFDDAARLSKKLREAGYSIRSDDENVTTGSITVYRP